LESPTLVEEAAEALRAQLAEIRGLGDEGNPGSAGGAQALAPDEIEVLARLSELDST
jgi:hypothetical protein